MNYHSNIRKQIFILIPIICCTLTLKAQEKHRYKDFVCANVVIKKDLNYNPGASGDKKPFLFDLYQPDGDKARKRPLIIWMHGGGFKFGSKSAKGVTLWSKTFAQRGYVCANINYTLSKKNPIFHFDVLMQSSYYATQDLRTAIRYFKQHAVEYGIDPDKIILAGNSAGGILALQEAYSTNKELADMAKIPGDSLAKVEPNGRIKVAAVINLWGGIYDLDWLKNAPTPVINILGSNDSVMPPRHKSAPLYGGEDISDKATALGIPNQLKVFDGYSHELQKHFNPIFPVSRATQQRWLEAGQDAADFLYRSVSL